MKAGSTFPSLFAMIARRHMYQYGTTREHLAAVAVKNHANGALNPDAHMRKVITLEQALAGKPMADPLTLYDCSLISDGAAAVLLAPAERARRVSPVSRYAFSASRRLPTTWRSTEKPDITTFPAVRRAAQKAYHMAGVSPADIQFARIARLLHHRRNRRPGRPGVRPARRGRPVFARRATPPAAAQNP